MCGKGEKERKRKRERERERGWKREREGGRERTREIGIERERDREDERELVFGAGGSRTSRATRCLCRAAAAANARTYRGTSLIRNRNPSGPFSRTMPRAVW